MSGDSGLKGLMPWLLISAVIMLGLPWLAVTFVKGDGGMAVCFILFFAVNPVYAVVSGIYAGMDMQRMWALPVITAVLFLAGTWIMFDIGETEFILYALIYLGLGTGAMLISGAVKKKRTN